MKPSPRKFQQHTELLHCFNQFFKADELSYKLLSMIVFVPQDAVHNMTYITVNSLNVERQGRINNSHFKNCVKALANNESDPNHGFSFGLGFTNNSFAVLDCIINRWKICKNNMFVMHETGVCFCVNCRTQTNDDQKDQERKHKFTDKTFGSYVIYHDTTTCDTKNLQDFVNEIYRKFNHHPYLTGMCVVIRQ